MLRFRRGQRNFNDRIGARNPRQSCEIFGLSFVVEEEQIPLEIIVGGGGRFISCIVLRVIDKHIVAGHGHDVFRRVVCRHAVLIGCHVAAAGQCPDQASGFNNVAAPVVRVVAGFEGRVPGNPAVQEIEAVFVQQRLLRFDKAYNWWNRVLIDSQKQYNGFGLLTLVVRQAQCYLILAR